MQVHVCDKCGDITGLNHKIIFIEPVNGHKVEICLCRNCFNDILEPLIIKQKSTHERFMNYIKENKS